MMQHHAKSKIAVSQISKTQNNARTPQMMNTREKVEQKDEEKTRGGLHARLNHEAEKIRKWKVQTELELKAKDLKLQEAEQTVKNLRKSSLELQLQNENLSQKLEEEMRSKEEIGMKINATRNMCNLLKDYTSKLDERMQKCEVEKTEIKYLEKEHSKQFEALTDQFRSLGISASETKQKLESDLIKEREEKQAISEACKQQLSTAEAELQELHEKFEHKEQQIAKLNIEVTSNRNELQQLYSNYENVQRALSTSREELQNSMANLQDVQQQLSSSKAHADDVDTKLAEVSARYEEAVEAKDRAAKHFDETERLYVEMIKKNQNEIETAHDKLQTEARRCSDYQVQLTALENNVEALKCEKDMLIMERTESTQAINSLKIEKETLLKQIGELQKEVSNMSDQCNKVNSELLLNKLEIEKYQRAYEEKEEESERRRKDVDKLNVDVSRCRDEIEEKMKEMSSLREDLTATSEREKQLFEEVGFLREQLRNESGENKQALEKTTELHHEKKSLEKELSKLNKDLDKSKKKEAEIKSKFEDAKREIKEWRLKNADMQQILKEEAAKAESLLEQEADAVNAARDELSKTNAEFASCKEKLSQMAAEIEQKEQISSTLENQLKESESLHEKARKDLAAVEKHCELEIAQMTRVMGDYKKEYDDLFRVKDTELEQQKQQLEQLRQQLQAVNQQTSEAVLSKEASVQEYCAQVQSLTNQLEVTKSSINEYDEKMELLEAEIKEKDGELCALRQQNAELNESKALELSQLKQRVAELENGEICALRQQNEELEKRRAFELAEMNKKMADLQNGELCALRQQNAELAESKAREVAQLSKQIADLQDAMKSRPAAPSTPRVSARDESTAAAAAAPRTPRTPKQGSQPQDAVQTPVIRRASSLKDIRTPKQAFTPTPAFMQDDDRMETPLCVGTPGILKRANTQSAKKRRVMFASTQRDSDDACDSDHSSSSEVAMEIEVDEMEKRQKGSRAAATPVLFKQSPKVPSKQFTTNRKTSMKPVPRGLTVRESANVQTPVASKGKTELEKIKAHFPEKMNMKARESPAAGQKKEATAGGRGQGNVRKAAVRTGGKFFSASPGNKMKSLREKKSRDELAWFESDDVFGFGSED